MLARSWADENEGAEAHLEGKSWGEKTEEFMGFRLLPHGPSSFKFMDMISIVTLGTES